MKKIIIFYVLFMGFLSMHAQNVTITQATGWMETAYVKWTPVSGVDSYKVYYTGGTFTDKIIDTQLIRNYGSYYRADVLGLSAGIYTIKVVPVTANVDGPATVSAPITVTAHDRSGFAHSNGRIPGAYNLDGTLKANAVVLYVTQDTKNTISMNVTGANANPCVGLQTILDGFKKGLDTRPLDIRMIGNVTDPNYMLNGDIVIENKKIAASSITFEGVGSDALVNGWGIRIKSATNIEVRNLGFMLTDASEGDNLSLQQDNSYVWAHNNDLFYGAPGSDADQAKGDGALDSKKSTYVTFSYNHFWDNGKSCLLGLSEGTTTDLYITYHHNWFDHSDSRHPRVRYFSAHVYNNYYDGNSKYGVGSTLGSSIFVEGNYFRNCKYPMLISKQGTDIAGGAPGTFSNEDGGMIKAHNNYMTGQTAFVPYSSAALTQFDAYVATNRNEVLTSSITAAQGGATYNNFDTNAALYINSLVIDNPLQGRDKTMQFSGRVSGGDISWTFSNAGDDTSSSVNTGLMALLQNYTSQLVSVQGITSPTISSQTLTIPANNDQTIVTATAMSPMIFTWGGTATDVTVTGLPVSGVSFVKNTTNKTVTVSGNPTDDVSFTVITVGSAGTPVSGTGGISVIAPGTAQGNEIHNFTTSALSSSFYTFTSANINSTDGSATYDGLTLTKRLKLESATSIAYNTLQASTLTLVFDPTFTGTVKFDNVNYTASAGIVTIQNVAAGAHTITKGSVANLFYIKTVFNSGTLGTQENSKGKFSVYPNPVSSVLTIATPSNSLVEKVIVTNSAGQVVKKINETITKVDMSNLSNGVYFLQIKTKEGIFNQKIIKK
ncbi:T9SS type A sorting domain-containing protein [Chryseobacterium chendengshani]|uniref:pectate lyase family protein n=1 Tax=Chryseobacterium sp. LJ668 TaxID=2864040 RepID=UPI001C6875BB|nr:T9SS type A sorting domain-containing protein [Chryseobacterium sp. LJ668]MBW8522473.1 T9SS type A sorting domain-containing protein [Chryseobacterium sp. LJ668]QYK16014.1 T9SS type A sorting domain-containing protein [Chryseobacterium sp. LJ668]